MKFGITTITGTLEVTLVSATWLDMLWGDALFVWPALVYQCGWSECAA